jgi:hypothetical protein
MIIQLATNMFERIESLLGLPTELRIGTRDDNHQGLLETEGFLELAVAIIRKDELGSPKHCKGGMRSLREDMEKSKVLLRTRIAP